jgi:isoleucyl-tRNA synthetase
VGLGYIPPFPEYYHHKNGDKNHKIYHADFITDTDGTGIGHEAPEFGDVDFQLAKKEGIYISEAMDEAGRYTAQIFDYVGTHYLDLENPEKGANKINIERMKANNTLFKLEGITHRVPFCPRSGTPLMQKAQDSWFIDIQSQKDKLIEANEQINWFPEYLKEWRFKKGIESAPDWCISRTRYWGAPMPVWIGEDGEQLVVSSRDEIFEYNQAFDQLEKREIEWKTIYFFKWGEFDGTEFNLHKPYIDVIKLKSPKTGNTLTRIPEVLDVWLDSGSMPYAQMHYPFENKEAMQASFPADFIAEYVWQIRAWFYVMHVLGVLLNPTGQEKPTPSFTNVITTGVVNGNDGRKMSKSFGNYPDPRMAIEKYGADPIRFYMLNSPLLSGGDMDFKEEGIMETIKGVMLPIWNTYSFFTTYANIDKWEKDETKIVLMRHGETETNANNGANGWSTDTGLTEKWREQAILRGKEFKLHGEEFDIIIVTPVKRTHETAKIIANEIGFNGIIDEMNELLEQHMGEAEWRNVDELRNEWIKEHGNDIGWTRIYRENSKESFDDFTARVAIWLRKVQEKYHGKKILIVAHAGTARAISRIQFWQDKDTAMWKMKTLENCWVIPLINAPIVNPLDSWILSRLQVLIGQVHDAMDGYDVSRGCRHIVAYMDELTNWYVRLSRRRFWESGMTPDKSSAYETLHTVLSELSKLLAPFMPFISESIYQGLTGRESVHLEYVTNVNKHFIANDLNRDMEICEHIVSLGLALRSRKNIRVRQPLSTITITRELDEYYQTIIRDELNVKEIKFENPEKLAKKICKPDARKIGPKYGKDVQKVIVEAKNGNFVEKDNGIIDVGGFILEAGEYTMEYLPLEGTLDVEGGYGMVVGLDTHITEDLKTEWYARDIIRMIQDMRKEADYNVTDRIKIQISGESSGVIVDNFGHIINSETLSSFTEITSPDLSKTENLDENISITIKISR